MSSTPGGLGSRALRRPGRRGAAWSAGLVSFALAAVAGCAPRGATLSVVSYKDAYFPERHELSFDDCMWRRLPGGDYQFAAATPPGESPRRLLDVRVFWNPSTGRLRTNATSMDAAIRCVIVSPGGAIAVYHGTGFVYFKPGHGPITARVESGQLRLVTGAGEGYTDWGETRITGRLRAAPDAVRALDVTRECDRLAAQRTAAAP